MHDVVVQHLVLDALAGVVVEAGMKKTQPKLVAGVFCALLASLIEGDTGPTFIRDCRTGLVWANGRAVDEFGLGGNILTWDDFVAILHREDVRRLEDAHSQAFKTQKRVDCSLRLNEDDAHKRWLCSTFPFCEGSRRRWVRHLEFRLTDGD